MEASRDSATVTRTTNARVKTLAELMQVCEVDPATWEVDRWICEKYDCVSVPRAEGNDRDGWERKDARPQITEMYLVKAWLVRKKPSATPESFDRAYRSYKQWIGWTGKPAKPPRSLSTRSSKISIINDLHCPFHDQDALREFVRREAESTDELVVAGDVADFFNFSRFQKLSQPFTPVQEFQETQKVLVLLSEHFRKVRILRGNHDGARMVKMLSDMGVPAQMIDYFEALCPGFSNPLEVMVKELPNVEMVEPIKLDYAKFGFLYQIGDLIVSHAESYSTTPLVGAGNTLAWLQKFALPQGIVKPFKHVAQAHTHGAGKVWGDYGCWAYELGCLCLYPEYVSDPKIKTPRPWKRGYSTFYQENGVTDSVRSNFIPFEDLKPVT